MKTVTNKQHTASKTAGNGFFYITVLGVVSNFLTFIFTFHQIGVGIWPQSELATAWLHFSAALCSIGLLGVHITRPHLTRLMLGAPALWAFALAALSVVLIGLHDLPMRSILGSVRTGEGIVWWLDVSVITAAAMVAWQTRPGRRLITAMAVLSFGTCFALSVSHSFFRHYITPYYFADYAALLVIALVPFLYGWVSKKTAGHMAGAPLFVCFYVVVNALILMTENKAIAAFSLSLPLVMAALWWSKALGNDAKNRLSFVMVAAIPVVWLLFCATFLHLDIRQGYYDFIDAGIMKTLISRIYLLAVSLSALFQDWTHVFTGYGWGRYVDFLTYYQPSDWLNFTTFSGQWDGFSFDHFHSHNMFMEAWGAAGFFGAVILFCYILSFVYTAKAGMKKPALLFSAGLMTWASMWFVFPLHVPAFAFASASLCRRASLRTWRRLRAIRAVPYITTAVLAVAACLQVGAGALTAAQAYKLNDFDPASMHIDTAGPGLCPSGYDDFGAGGMHLSRLVLDRLRYTVDLAAQLDHPETIRKKPKGPPPTPEKIRNHILALNTYFCMASDYMNTHKTSARLSVAHLMMRGEVLLALDLYLTDAERAYYYAGWEAELTDWITHYPQRYDLASPYMLYHVLHQQEARLLPIANVLYKQDKTNPLGLWFKGLYLLNDPTRTQQALFMMRKALDNGIERFILVEEDVKAMLLGLE